MLAASLELCTLQAEAVDQYSLHESGFLFLGVVGAGLEEQPLGVLGLGPCAHGQTELDIGLDLA